MPLTTVAIQGNITYPDGTSVDSGIITFTLVGNGTDTTDSTVAIPSTVYTTTSSSGVVSTNLWPNDRGVSSTYYKVGVTYQDQSTGKNRLLHLGNIQVPESGAPHDLNLLLSTGIDTANTVVSAFFSDAEVAAINVAISNLLDDTLILENGSGTDKFRIRVTGIGESVEEVDISGTWTEVSRTNVTSGSSLAGRKRFQKAPLIGTSVSNAVEPFYTKNLQKQIPDGIHYASNALLTGKSISPTKPIDIEEITVSTATPYLVSVGDYNRIFYCTNASSFLDLQFMLPGQTTTVVTSTSGGVTLYTGENGSWIGGSETNKVFGSSAVVKVLKVSANLYVADSQASSTESSTLPPARSETIVTLGQSLSVQIFNEGGLAGIQSKGITDIWAISAGLGSTSLLDHWWDVDLSVPRTVATDALAAITGRPSGQPAPSVLIWDQGEADAYRLADTGDYTPARYKTALQELFAWFRTQLSDSTLPIVIIPLGSADNNLNPKGYWAVRRIQGEVATADTYTEIGPDKYDLDRNYGDVHLTFSGQITLGERIGEFLDNLLNSATNRIGPSIYQVTQLSNTQVAVDIDKDSGILLKCGATPGFLSDPEGFALLSDATIAADLFEVESYSWTTDGVYDRLLINTTEDCTGFVFAYPYGPMPRIRTGSYIRDFVTHKPLRTYVA